MAYLIFSISGALFIVGVLIGIVNQYHFMSDVKKGDIGSAISNAKFSTGLTKFNRLMFFVALISGAIWFLSDFELTIGGEPVSFGKKEQVGE